MDTKENQFNKIKSETSEVDIVIHPVSTLQFVDTKLVNFISEEFILRTVIRTILCRRSVER